MRRSAQQEIPAAPTTAPLGRGARPCATKIAPGRARMMCILPAVREWLRAHFGTARAANRNSGFTERGAKTSGISNVRRHAAF